MIKWWRKEGIETTKGTLQFYQRRAQFDQILFPEIISFKMCSLCNDEAKYTVSFCINVASKRLSQSDFR